MGTKPHRCPVCEGKRPAMDNCDACEGKGVVWEPEAAHEAGVSAKNGDELDLTFRRE